jgi:uncharacterized protein YukE
MTAASDSRSVSRSRLPGATARTSRLGPAAPQSPTANTWMGLTTDAAETSAIAGAAVSAVGDTWRGGSNTAFSGLMSRFGQASSSMQQSLSNAASTMNKVADDHEQVQTTINMIVENLLNRVSAATRGQSGPPRSQPRSADQPSRGGPTRMHAPPSRRPRSAPVRPAPR